MLSKAERNGGLYEQREMFGEGVAGIGPASRFVVLGLLGPHPSHYLSIPKRKCCTASREPLQFIVMSVMVVISLYLWDYGMIVPWRCVWGPSCCRHFSVIEGTV